MTADIYTFMANFSGGGQRPNRYEVVITFPEGISDIISAKKISFSCRSSGIPGSSIGIASVPYKGREIKIPGDKNFDDWNVSILLDTDFVGRTIFERWHDGILGFTSNVTREDWIDPVNIYGSATVTALGRDDLPNQTYTVEGIFPVNVGEIALAYDQNNVIAEQQVSFAVNGWKSDVTT